MTNDEIFQYEKEKLKQAIEEINKKIAIAENNFKRQQNTRIGFSEGKRGTQFTRQSLMSLYATEANELKSTVNSPYFGKFEFKQQDGEIKKIYIGKKGITSTDNKPIAYDWRSPVCSVYYDYGVGEAEYKTNGKIQKGEILSKRQILIKNGELKKVEDADVVSNDLILLKYLKENSNARLKSIIATIQKEQNNIIRSPLKENYIIQGVAGSGKTTVALHRIAYLIYNEAKNIKDTEFMILGPNKYFLNYISDLLPDLDIRNTSQSTFEELTLKSIKSKIKVGSKSETLKKVLSGDEKVELINYKSSLGYMKLIESFVDAYIYSHLKESIVYEGIELCSKEELKDIYNNSRYYAYSNYANRIDKFSKILINRIKDKKDDLCHEVWQKYRDEYLSLDKKNPRRQEILDITNEIEKNIKKGCPKQIKEYFKFINVDLIHLYQAFIENIEYMVKGNNIDLNELKMHTLDNIKSKKIASEDLAAISLMNYIINGSKYEDYKHLVIDEAQDLSYAEYYVLRKMFKKANFDIYGDINQSIYDYQSINNWQELNNLLFDNECNILNLDKSYRTTKQISDTSNLVLNFIDSNNTNCIARDGNDIKIYNIEKNKENQIIKELDELLNKNYDTIAIICKDDNEAKTLYNKLKKLNLNINIIKDKNEDYYGGITIVPSYLSKGLEFDAVILYNANKDNYKDNNIDQKLLYVGITRAMHDLYINYKGEISNSLTTLLQKEKIKELKK